MKYLKYFESKFNTHTDEISDVFLEYADKWRLKESKDPFRDQDIDPVENYFQIEHDYYKDGLFPIRDRDEYLIFILFSDDFGFCGVDGYLSEEFQSDMKKFLDRIKHFGFTFAEVNWEGGSCYQIIIRKK